MKTIIVKIDRSSIKKNPNAFMTTTTIIESVDCTFKWSGYKKPEWFDQEGIVVTTVVQNSMDNFIEIEGIIKNPEQFKDYFKEPGMTINYKNNFRDLHHRPEPEYLYDYEKTYVKCNHCKEKVEVQKIDIDYIFDGEDEVKVETCPLCFGENTFPNREFEKLSDVLK
jgi:hypothetical protein